ncbi:hypothetical protein niasHT_016530 [Heterodera trifolii]|uniref:AAA+ ATPase domain-containing protein n=1 Tax=Heterodera trifolii TaxID=157864 RepID=A0ABD2L623_9BILA
MRDSELAAAAAAAAQAGAADTVSAREQSAEQGIGGEQQRESGAGNDDDNQQIAALSARLDILEQQQIQNVAALSARLDIVEQQIQNVPALSAHIDNNEGKVLSVESSLRALDERIDRTFFGTPGNIHIDDFAAVLPEQEPPTRYTFDDLFELPDVLNEVKKQVDFLRNPGHYKGCQLPKALFLFGMPGTGKSHVARTIARESECCFAEMEALSETSLVHSATGLEMTLQGTFNAAVRPRLSCVLLIKKVEKLSRPLLENAIDRAKNADGFLLVCTSSVLLPPPQDLFDNTALYRKLEMPWLLMPRRFRLLSHWTEGTVLLTPDNLNSLAKSTVGFSAKELFSLISRAKTEARLNREELKIAHFTDAFTAILRQVEPSWRIPDSEEKWSLCAHEIGHAIVTLMVPGALPLRYVTIIPAAGTLGETVCLAKSDQLTTTKERLFGTIESLLAGRIAEELWVSKDKVSTACSRDLEQAEKLAYFAAAKCGFDDQLGLITIAEGREPGPELKNKIDAAVQRILHQCGTDALNLLLSIEEHWRELVTELHRKEHLEVQEVLDFISKHGLKK